MSLYSSIFTGSVSELILGPCGALFWFYCSTPSSSFHFSAGTRTRDLTQHRIPFWKTFSPKNPIKCAARARPPLPAHERCPEGGGNRQSATVSRHIDNIQAVCLHSARDANPRVLIRDLLCVCEQYRCENVKQQSVVQFRSKEAKMAVIKGQF